jgi:hypothetical protein
VEQFRGVAWELTGVMTAADLPPAARLLVHLAAHASTAALDRRLRLVQLVDIAVLGASLDPDGWRAVSVAVAGRERFVWPALALAAAWLAAPIPAATLDRLGASVRPALRDWTAAASADALSREGRAVATRPLGEVFAVWPASMSERLRMARFIVWPSLDLLADRYERAGRLPGAARMRFDHLVYTARLAGRRFRRREPRPGGRSASL